MKRVFYPYFPRKPQNPRYPNVYFFEYVDGQGIVIGNGVTEVQGSELIDVIKEGRSGAWFITYGFEFLGELMPHLIETFDKISYIGTNSKMIYLEVGERRYYLIDLFQFFAKPLSEVTRALGIEGDVIYSKTHDTSKYVMTKALVIQEVWERYANLLHNAFGIYPSKSPGATALRTWATMAEHTIKPRGKRLTKFMRGGVSGGALHWRAGYYEEAYLYDINASYIQIMRETGYPLEVYPFRGGAPEMSKWIATVKINYKSRYDFSPMAVRLYNQLIVHPQEAQETRVCLTHVDYALLSRFGEIELVEWVEGIEWNEEAPLFQAWAKKIERLSVSPANKLLLKITSRALHSKFAQRTNPYSEIIRVTGKEAAEANRVMEFYPLEDGKLAIRVLRKPHQQFRAWLRPDWEAITLSLGRKALYEAMDTNTVYCDTDSLISTVRRNDLDVGACFGQWKLEQSGGCAIVGPRAYTIGDKIVLAGASLVDTRHAGASIVQVAQGGEGSRLQTKVRDAFTLQNHSIVYYNYPYVETRGNLAYITQSPTREEVIIPIRRYIS